MEISRKGSYRDKDSQLLVKNNPFGNVNVAIRIGFNFGSENKPLIVLSSGNNSDPQSASTYDYTVKLSANDFKNILEKIVENYAVNPDWSKGLIQESSNTLLKLLLLSTGLINNVSERE